MRAICINCAYIASVSKEVSKTWHAERVGSLKPLKKTDVGKIFALK